MEENHKIPNRFPAQTMVARETLRVGFGETERPGINVIAVAWRRRWIVIFCVIVALGLGVVHYVRSPRIYSSSSVVYIQQPPNAVKDDASTNSGGSTLNYLFTQCSLIQSTAILSSALEMPGVADVKALRGIESPVGFLKSTVTALPSKVADLIVVSMESTDPKDASIIVNGVVQAYIDYQSKQHQSTAVVVVNILKSEADRHEADLKADQQKMLALKKDNPELAVQTEKGGVAAQRMSDLYTKLSAAQFRAVDLKTYVLEAEAASGDPLKLRHILDQAQLPGDVSPFPDPQLLAEFRAQQRLIETMTDNHLLPGNPNMIAAQTRLDRLQTELQQASQTAISSSISLLKQSQESADENVKRLTDALKEERSTMVGLNVVQAEYDEIAQDAERSGKALDLLDSRVKDINVNEDFGSLTITVLETAKPDWTPVRPVQSKILGIALIGGLMAGLALALLRDVLDQRLRTLDEIASLLELPILGAVPRIMRKTTPTEQGRETFVRPKSNVAEAYRTIRTAIYFGLAEDRLVKTILVTSPSPGEGKSTSIGNLAIAIVQAGRRVLVIDADCRRPTQHKIFKLADGPGLSNLLAGQCTLDAAIRKTDIDRLDVLPCGSIPHNPAELLDSQAFLDVLREVARQYDQVLIDSPPVLPVTDARILAASCDATVLLLRGKRSTRRSASLAREALVSVGANILGVIINDVSKSGNGYDYSYYGHGRYGSTISPKMSINGNGAGHSVTVVENAIIER